MDDFIVEGCKIQEEGVILLFTIYEFKAFK
jgi:hypothetical protein